MEKRTEVVRNDGLGRSGAMKYTRNGSRYTTEDGRYTIKKNYNTGAYTIYDFDKHESIKDKCR